MSISPTPSGADSLSDRFAALVADVLVKAIADLHARNRWIPDAIVLLLWTRAKRLGARFAMLARKAEAGVAARPAAVLPAGARPAVAALPAGERPARKPRVRSTWEQPVTLPALSRRCGWLLRLTPEAALINYRLDLLLNEPAFAAVATSSPQMVRLMKSLCWMVRVDFQRFLPPKPPRKRRSLSPEMLADRARARAARQAERRAIRDSIFNRPWPLYPGEARAQERKAQEPFGEPVSKVR